MPQKAVSLDGPGWYEAPLQTYPNDYLYKVVVADPAPGDPNRTKDTYPNRDFIVGSGTRFVRVWVDWNRFMGQESPPTSLEDCWNKLNAKQDTWCKLDSQILSMTQSGIYPVLASYQAHPRWSNPGGSDPTRKRYDEWRLPSDLSTGGPWAWWISYLMCRYKQGVPTNDTGPHVPKAGESSNAYYGNRSGAFIWALCPCNEINQLGWGRDLVAATVEMIRTSAALQAFFGAPAQLYVPDMSDTPNTSDNGYVEAIRYAELVLQQLRNSFSPAGFVGWSHHIYDDIKYGTTKAFETWSRLGAYEWKGRSADRYILFTEGGLNLKPGDQTAKQQLDKCTNHFQNGFAPIRSYVPFWTNHQVRDGGSFWTGFYATNGAIRPWGTVWGALSTS